MSYIGIVGVDPGDTTGLAVWTPSDPMNIVHYETKADGVAVHLQNLVYMNPDVTWIFAVERFIIGRNTIKKKHATKTAPGLIGEIRNVAAQHDLEVRLRGASESKIFTPNERLKKLGWYKPGMGHANDAARQIVLCMAECFPATFTNLMERCS